MAKRRCSKCNRVGHYAPTCSSKGKKASKKKASKKKVKRKSTSSKGKGYKFSGSGGGWKVFHYGGITGKGNLSNKTWAIKISGNTVTTRWGKSWGEKRETPKRFSSREKAMIYYRNKIREKLNKGYSTVRRKSKLRKRA